MTDPITDMLNRIRNAQAVFQPAVDVPMSNLKYEIARLLEKNGFVEAIEKKSRRTKKMLKIVLKYHKDAGSFPSRVTPAIKGMRRISKPGQRIYVPANKLRRVRGGYGIIIISTSKGLMTNKEAKKQKLGGEVLCEVW